MGSVFDLSVTVQIERLIEGGGQPRVRVDLSELGGAADAALIAVDDSTFRLDTQVQLNVPNGLYRLRAYIEQEEGGELRSAQFSSGITVFSRSDLVLVGDALAEGWRTRAGAGPYLSA